MSADDEEPGSDGSVEAALRPRPSSNRSEEEKAARREARRQQIEKALEEELDSLNQLEILETGPRERVLPPPRRPPPVPKPAPRICAGEDAIALDKNQSDDTDSSAAKRVWGQRAWSPEREIQVDATAVALENESSQLQQGLGSAYTQSAHSFSGDAFEWESKARAQRIDRMQTWKAAAVERERLKAQREKEQREKEAAREAAKHAAFLEAQAKFRPGEEALHKAKEALRLQRAKKVLEAKRQQIADEEQARLSALSAAEQARKNQLQQRLLDEERKWQEHLEEERRQLEESQAEWVRDREATMAGVESAMSAIQNQRQVHEERARRDMARLDRLAEERRSDLEEHLKRWAEQHQRAEEAQKTASASFVRNFRDTWARADDESRAPRGTDSSRKNRSQPPPRTNHSTPPTSNQRHAGGHTRSSASAERPRAPTMAPRPAPRPAPRQAADPLQVAMADVAARLRAALDLPADKRKAVLAELRLKWHPDKNPDNAEVATKVFQFMQELKDKLWS